ncbi:MAG: hypothetical protein HPPSJP_0480 [Candidatus Hepatoplasma scabrum]|nr:MAG: hypothetical protein HPPSJP_0480 [Candidatus Hepatoplasma sp.]
MKEMGFLLQRVKSDFLKNYFTEDEYCEYLNNIENNKYIDRKIYLKIKELNIYLKTKDFELFDFITENIISFDQCNNNILKIYDDFFSYHQKILTIFFDNFILFEKLIKNKIINSINYFNINSLYELIRKIIDNSQNKIFVKRFKFIFSIFYSYNREKAEKIVNSKNKNKINEDELFISLYKNSDKATKRYFDYKLINEFSFSDIIDFFTILKDKNYKNYLNIRIFLINLLGEKKYNNFYQQDDQNNIINWFLSNYKAIKILRNKVMHNKVLFTNMKELNKGIDSLIKLSNQEKNNIGDLTYKKFLKETFTVLKKINQNKASNFFKNELIKFH